MGPDAMIFVFWMFSLYLFLENFTVWICLFPYGMFFYLFLSFSILYKGETSSELDSETIKFLGSKITADDDCSHEI